MEKGKAILQNATTNLMAQYDKEIKTLESKPEYLVYESKIDKSVGIPDVTTIACFWLRLCLAAGGKVMIG